MFHLGDVLVTEEGQEGRHFGERLLLHPEACKHPRSLDSGCMAGLLVTEVNVSAISQPPAGFVYIPDCE